MDFIAFSASDTGDFLDVEAFPKGPSGGAKAFSILSLGESCIDLGSALLTFPEFCPSAARRDLEPGTQTSGSCTTCFLSLSIAGCLFCWACVDELGERFSIIFLTSES